MVGRRIIYGTSQYEEPHRGHHDVGEGVGLLSIDEKTIEHEKLNGGRARGRGRPNATDTLNEIFPGGSGLRRSGKHDLPGQSKLDIAGRQGTGIEQQEDTSH
jgi:hypothetical protein